MLTAQIQFGSIIIKCTKQFFIYVIIIFITIEHCPEENKSKVFGRLINISVV